MDSEQIQATKDRIQKRVDAMSNEELAAFVSKSMMSAEIGIAAAAERLCEASQNRTDVYAMTMLVMKRAEHTVKAAHCDLSAANAQILSVPVPRAGDR